MILDQVISFPADHPALDGHFPGNPVVPGALLLDHAVGLAGEACGRPVTGLRAAKFLHPLKPEAACRLQLVGRDDGSLKLTCSSGGETILTAILEGAADAERP